MAHAQRASRIDAVGNAVVRSVGSGDAHGVAAQQIGARVVFSCRCEAMLCEAVERFDQPREQASGEAVARRRIGAGRVAISVTGWSIAATTSAGRRRLIPMPITA